MISIILLVLVGAVVGDCDFPRNEHPFIQTDPYLVKTTHNAALYKYPNDTNNINVVHLWGNNWYELGYAQGEMMKDTLPTFIAEVLEHLGDLVDPTLAKYIGVIPKSSRYSIYNFFFEELGGRFYYYFFNYYWAGSKMPEEIQGIADASGVSVGSLFALNNIPEWLRMGCSMLGAYGNATYDGNVYQLRALDWDMEGPFQKYTQVSIYHPPKGDGHAWAQVTYPGFLGAVTGMNEAGLGISEKNNYHWWWRNETQSRFGYPNVLFMRDVLQYDTINDQAAARAESIRRTEAMFFGVGDKTTNTFFTSQYGNAFYHKWTDESWAETAWESHPVIENVLYFTQRNQPDKRNECLRDRILEKYGAIDPEFMIRDWAAVQGTGDTHAAVYDLNRGLMYVAAASTIEEGAEPAFSRPWLIMDLNYHWNVTNHS